MLWVEYTYGAELADKLRRHTHNMSASAGVAGTTAVVDSQ